MATRSKTKRALSTAERETLLTKLNDLQDFLIRHDGAWCGVESSMSELGASLGRLSFTSNETIEILKKK